MKIITNANQLKIIKAVSTPNISKTLDVQKNDAIYLSNRQNDINTADTQ
jgi:hypothetical protein